MKHKITLNNVSKRFGKFSVLEGISFEVYGGQFVSIVGPSGCGKTSLLYLIQGFTEKDEGKIETDGRTGFIFQEHNLFPWKTVKDNIMIGPLNNGKKNEAEKITNEILKEINLFEFKDYYPHQISGGMKQRVGIARCLANNPHILLMDEPFGSLDYFTKLKMQDFILKLQRKLNLTILFVTHDIDEAIKLSNKIIVLSKRPAKINTIINLDETVNKANVKDNIMKHIEI